MPSPTVTAGGGPAPALKPRRKMKMTGWYDPVMLLQTGIRVLVSTIFGEFADRRETIAISNAIAAQPFDESFDYSAKTDDQGDFWFDFLADTGDGWDSTLAVARLVTAPFLDLQGQKLPRGRILIFGGDEVYPTPSRQAYEDRLVGPYEEALGALPAAQNAPMPDLYALPGNHDWYDGLSAFLSLFCRRRIASGGFAGTDRPGRPIAGRKTFQTRSYFALKLPHGWWLWGTDSQIEGYLDQPQVDFFQFVASEWMDPGSKVILCSGQPSWAYADTRAPEKRFTTFSYLERLPGLATSRAGAPMGHELRLVLTGDSHHYSRYAENETVQYITAGGGGAFLHPTHHLEDRSFSWDYPPPNEVKAKPTYIRDFKLQAKIGSDAPAVFPDRTTSRSLTARNAGFAFLNPYMLLFYWVAYALFLWSLEASSLTATGKRLGEALGAEPSYWCALLEQVAIGFATPWPFLLFIASLLAYVYFTDEPYTPIRRWAIGLGHGLVQAGAVIAVTSLSFWLSARADASGVWLRDVAPIFSGSLASALTSATVLGLYLWIALNGFGIQWDEAFSSLRIKDFKNFLRLRIGPGGELEVYPVGLARVPRNDDTARLAPELIEGPVPILSGNPKRPTRPPRKAIKK